MIRNYALKSFFQVFSSNFIFGLVGPRYGPCLGPRCVKVAQNIALTENEEYWACKPDM